MSSLKWQAHFIHFQKNVWEYPSLNSHNLLIVFKIKVVFHRKKHLAPSETQTLPKCFSSKQSHLSTQPKHIVHASHFVTKNIKMFPHGLRINKIHNFYCFIKDFSLVFKHTLNAWGWRMLPPWFIVSDCNIIFCTISANVNKVNGIIRKTVWPSWLFERSINHTLRTAI